MTLNPNPQPRVVQNKLDTGQKNKIGALLYAHLHNTNDGFSAYDEGWSDERIAREVGVADARLIKYRRERDPNFHPLRPEAKATSPEATATRLTTLEAKHNALVEFIARRVANGNTELSNSIHQFKV